MKIYTLIQSLSMVIATFGIISADDTDLEVFFFGKSYHTNRQCDWNEDNWGLAGGLTYGDSWLRWNAMVGSYRDSFYMTAKFAVIGPRVFLGEPDGFNGCIGLGYGYYEGSGVHGLGGLPYAGIGYGPVNLMVTGYPSQFDPDKNPESNTGLVSVFVKLRLLTF